ncbi:MAG: MOSC domain-containing protein [Paracoccus sp. (in: a-proteobacteria)]|nr:MOSC domain-containing protein [Paracoccus sp. (in: a-proteobacteria)]
MAELAAIFRYPLKSLGRERLEDADLAPGQIIEADRRYAILHEAGRAHLIAPAATGPAPLARWLPKKFFLRGAAAPALQAVSGGMQGDRLALRHPGHGSVSLDPERDDSRPLLDWLAGLLPEGHPAPLALVRGPAPLADDARAVVSILSLDSLRDLEARAGQAFGMDRWRGNLWIEGLAPWAERELIGQEISIGAVRMRVQDQITRCAATSASTESGQRDCDMPALLQDLMGHRQFGIYAEILTPGRIKTGAPLTLSEPKP